MNINISSLATKHILLRPIMDSDIDLLIKWRNDPTSIYLWSTRRNLISQTEARDEIAEDIRNNKHVWLMAQNARSVIGTIYSYDAQFVDEHCWVTTYVTDGFRSRGYGPDMLGLFLEHLFAYYNFRKIYLDAYGHNRASWHTMQNFGFAEEGRFPEHRYIDGKWHDLIRFAVYRRDLVKIRDYLARRSR